MDGYWDLALCVILQTIHDLEHGSSTRKADARRCIMDGGLDHWILQVAPSEARGVEIVKILVEMAQGKRAPHVTTVHHAPCL